MTVSRYLAVLSRTRSGYSGSFPDVPGCVASGKDLASTTTLLAEALALHLLDDPTPPQPLTTEIADLEEHETAIWIDPAPLNPVSEAVAGLIQTSGQSLRGLAAQLQMSPSVLHRLQDPFYWGHSVSSLRKLGDDLGQELHIEFRPKI